MLYTHRLMSANQQRRLKAHLRHGGVVAYPTESCFGLGCLPQHPRALRRLIAIKARSQDKGLIVIANKLTQLQPLLQPLSAPQIQQLNTVWPAATTFLIPCAPQVPPLLRGPGRHTLAVRIPAHTVARQLCASLQSALVSSSCNRSGKKACTTTREVKRQFGRQVWVVAGAIGSHKRPSQIYDLANGQRLR